MDSPYGNMGDVDTYLARAELMFELDRFDESREEIGGALSIDPAHVPSLTLLAVLELQVGNHDDALTAASAALAAEPTHEPAVLARGHALALLHRTDEALAVAEDITERNPDSWWHHVHYALIVRESRNGQDALDAAWVAVHLAPEDARAHLALAVVSASLGLDDLADRALSAAVRFDPDAQGYLEGELGPRLLRGSPHKAQPDSDTSGTQTTEPLADTNRSGLPPEARKIFTIAGGTGIVIPLVSGWWSGGDQDSARLIAGIGAVIAIVVLVVMLRRLSDEVAARLRDSVDTDKMLGLAIIAAALGPLLTGVFAVTGFVYTLPLALVAGIGAVLLAQRQYAW